VSSKRVRRTHGYFAGLAQRDHGEEYHPETTDEELLRFGYSPCCLLPDSVNGNLLEIGFGK